MLALTVLSPVAAAAQDGPSPEASPAAVQKVEPAALRQVVEYAATLPNLHALIVARHGVPLVEQAFRGPGLDRPVNVKSVSKAVISTLVGIAIERGVLDGVEQRIAPLMGDELPGDADPRVNEITIGDLLSMQAGLERTSGSNYGPWISSGNWVRNALSRPFVDEPGGRMLYSTGNSHLLSAILTRATGRSTLELARDWLGDPLGITIPPWTRDPQGIYLGGNEMSLSPRALLHLGELYRNGGAAEGASVVPRSWITKSWTPRARSPHTGHAYGYGWFITEMRGHPVYYAWGYGGQMLYVAPSLALTVVMTSDPSEPSGRGGYVRMLHALLEDRILPAVEGGAGAEEPQRSPPA